MALTLADTFGSAETPLGSVRVGGRDVAVLPLSFGRFQRLLALDAAALFSTLTERIATVLSFAAAVPWELARIVMPDVTQEEWAGVSDTAALAAFDLVKDGHDWEIVFDGLGFNDPTPLDDVAARCPQSKAELVAGLLAFCRTNPAYSVGDLYALRVDAFYALVKAQLEETERAAGGSAVIPPSMPIVRDPEKAAHFRRLFAEAESRA